MINHEPECIVLKRRGAKHVAELLSKKQEQNEFDFWNKRTERLRSSQKCSKKYLTTPASEHYAMLSEKQAEYNSKAEEKSNTK